MSLTILLNQYQILKSHLCDLWVKESINHCLEFFSGTELENGFEKSKHFRIYWLKPFV